MSNSIGGIGPGNNSSNIFEGGLDDLTGQLDSLNQEITSKIENGENLSQTELLAVQQKLSESAQLSALVSGLLKKESDAKEGIISKM